ncbi:hypothetical protein Lal_00021150 [Lupinus albus]|nr:hypothetical protein Lal_00021150 [Lupinus albus]
MVKSNLRTRNWFVSMADEMNNNGENYEGVDEIDVSEDGNINEAEEFDFEEINFGSLNEDEVKKYRFINNDITYNFYKIYGMNKGFGIRKYHTRRDKDGEILWQSFFCDREGFRDKKNELVRKRAPRKETRCDCLARMKIHIDKEKGDWYVSFFVDDHNHELVGEHYGGMIASNRSMTKTDAALMNTMREVGIGTGKNFGSFAGQSGGYRYIGFSKKDMYNKIEKQRRIGNGDAESALQYLKEQSKSDSAMYLRHSVDEEGKLQQLFWTDGCSIFYYSIFGDVLAFDATYGRNKYKFPVVIFSGVNHHKQTTVFAAGIVSNETEETYVWLLGNFLEAMNGKHPKCVITDVFITYECNQTSSHVIYKIGKHYTPNKKWHVSHYDNGSNVDIKCSCRRMKSFGMPCCHGVFVLLILDIPQLPSCLILERWTKKAKNDEGVNFQQCELSRESVKSSRYVALSDACRVLCNLACETEEDFSEMLEKIYNECGRLRSKQHSSSMENVDNATVDQVRDPVRVRAKGRVPGITSRPKRGNQCGICREIGHNRASCPNVVGSCSRTFDNDFDEE